MSISSDMFRGHTESIILQILSAADNYGYEITKFIKEKTQGLFDIKDATIYTAFRRMESDGLISTYWGDGVGGARRRYYTITQLGREELKKHKAEWQTVKGLLDGLIGG